MRNGTPNGNSYVTNIIDDFCRLTITYLLKSKTEAADCIKEYVKWTETQFNRKLKVMRSLLVQEALRRTADSRDRVQTIICISSWKENNILLASSAEEDLKKCFDHLNA